MNEDFKLKLQKLFNLKDKGEPLKRADIKASQGFLFSLKQLIPPSVYSFVGIKNKSQKLLAIDFEPFFTSIVYLERFGNELRLLDYDFKKISILEGRKDKVVEFISEFIKIKSIQEKNVYLSIPLSEGLLIKNFTLPVSPKGEMLEIIKWQLKDEVSFDLKNAIIDWKIVKEYVDEDGARKNEIICAVGKKEIITTYLAVVEECGLSLSSHLSPGPFNYQGILHSLNDKSKISIILHIGITDTTLCFYDSGQLRFLRKLSFSMEKLVTSLVATFTSDKGVVKFSLNDAEKLKDTYGIPQIQTKILTQGISALQVLSLMRPHLELLVREIKVTFNYYTEHFNTEIPSSIYLAGRGSNLKNLDKYLNEETNKTISFLTIPDFVVMNSEVKSRVNLKAGSNYIISALGLSLLGSKEINLLPAKYKLIKLKTAVKMFLPFTALVIAVVFIVSLFFVRYRLNDYENRLKQVKVYLKSLEGIKLTARKIQEREIVIAAVQKGYVPVEGLLKTISAILPSDIVLDSLVLDQNRHRLVLKGGIIKSSEEVEFVLAEFMRSIEESAFFSEASLLFSEKKGKVQIFKLKCDLIKGN